MGITWLEPSVAVDWVQQVKDNTDGPFLVNFVLHFEPKALEAVLREGVPMVTFSWGGLDEYRERIRQAREAGSLVGVQPANSYAASQLSEEADFLVCQGVEAGGHIQSSTPLGLIIEEVRRLCPEAPIVAAGGLSNSQHVKAILARGATAAMLGTRFVATQESRAHPAYKELLIESRQTALTNCFDGGWPNALHRTLPNRTLVEWEAAGSLPKPNRPNEGRVTARRGDTLIYQYDDAAPQIGMEGDFDAMCLYAGMGVDEITDIPSADDLVRRLLKELG